MSLKAGRLAQSGQSRLLPPCLASVLSPEPALRQICNGTRQVWLTFGMIGNFRVQWCSTAKHANEALIRARTCLSQLSFFIFIFSLGEGLDNNLFMERTEQVLEECWSPLDNSKDFTDKTSHNNQYFPIL